MVEAPEQGAIFDELDPRVIESESESEIASVEELRASLWTIETLPRHCRWDEICNPKLKKAQRLLGEKS